AESTKYFALLMAVGVLVGTYSSIFIASPLLVIWSGQKK
ncbi:MAG: protein translocase subunit SecF, partial [bacterium]|nr:protein translocase subunit SecF [bacterium]